MEQVLEDISMNFWDLKTSHLKQREIELSAEANQIWKEKGGYYKVEIAVRKPYWKIRRLKVSTHVVGKIIC